MEEGPRVGTEFGDYTRSRIRDRSDRASTPRARKARKIRYHDHEWDRIVAHARACGIPAATFVRRVSLGAKPRVRRNRTENELIVLLGQISADLQRLAHLAERAGDVRATVALARVMNETLQAVRKIG